MRVLLRVAGTRLKVCGREALEHGQTYLFIANHQSNLDPPLLIAATGRHLRFLAKDSLFRLPIIGVVLRLGGFVSVRREDRSRAIQAVELAAAALRRGIDFAVFAEGTRSRHGGLLPFKKGPFVLAIRAGVPVVPVAIRGTSSLLTKGDVLIRPGLVRIDFLDPMTTVGLTYRERTVLRDQVYSRIAAMVEASE